MKFLSNRYPALYRTARLRNLTLSRHLTQSHPTRPHEPPPHVDEPTTHFGYDDVPLGNKQRMVSSVFDSVAQNYDLMNDLMSLRVHRLWKDQFIRQMNPTGDMRILDCAGGTADIALRICAHINSTTGWAHTDASITVSDINENMLAVGRDRVAAQLSPENASRIHFKVADAQQLPFEDDSFDVYSISFGMRNVPEPHTALQEAKRVLKPGGRFMMLEFGQVRSRLVRQLYDSWSFGVIPAVGRIVAKDEAAYRYLVESIRRFPPQQKFLQMMQDAGLAAASASDYSLGIAVCYSAFKLPTSI